jgi:hypothetical protein
MIITITTNDGETIAISPEQHEIHTITGDEEKIAAVLSLIDDMRDNLGQIFAVGKVPDVDAWDKLMQEIREEAEKILKG